MRDKKKVLAILLFLIMGFFMFTFANPNDNISSLTKPVDEKKEEKKEDNNKQDNQEQTPVVVDVDNAPVITVEPKEVSIAFGANYDTLTGVTVRDDKDNLTAAASIVDTTTLEVGEYTIVYTATDRAGNTATNTRKLVVFEDLNNNNIPDEEEDHYTVSFEATGRGSLVGDTTYANILTGLTFEQAGIIVPTAVADEYYEVNVWSPVTPEDSTEVVEDITYVVSFRPINDVNENDIADEEETYTVTFVDYNDTILSVQPVLVNNAAVAPANPSRPKEKNIHYEFKGWDKDFSNITEDTVVKAVYYIKSIRSNIYEYHYNNPTVIATGIKDKTKGAYTKLGSVKIKVNDLTRSVTEKNVSTIVVLTNDEVSKYISGEMYSEEGYTFNWYVLKYESGDGWHIDGVRTANEYSLKVTFNYSNGTQAFEPVERTVKYNENYSVEVPVVEYYTANVTEIAGKVKGNIEVNVVYTPNNDENDNGIADELETYTVTFVDYNDKVLSTGSVLYGTAAVAPVDPKRPTSKGISYTFAGWDKDFSYITGNTTVKATYTISEITTMVFEYHYNDEKTLTTGVVDKTDGAYTRLGSAKLVLNNDIVKVTNKGVSKIVVLTNDEVMKYVDGPMYTEEGYTFDWYVLKFEKGDGWHIDGVRTANEYSLNVTFKYSNGTQAFDTVSRTVKYGEDYSVEVPEVDYYTANVTEISGKVTGNISVNVIYTPNNDLNNNKIADELEEHYSLTFIVEGPGKINNINNLLKRFNSDFQYEIVSDQKFVISNILKGLTYYKFALAYKAPEARNSSLLPPTSGEINAITTDAWHEADGSHFNNLATVTGDKTYYMTYYWDENQNNIPDEQEEFAVKFLDEDGNVLKTDTVKYGEDATAPEYTKESSAQYDYTITWDKAFTNVKGSLEVNAVVTPIVRSYDVTFVDYDGTIISTVSVEYGKDAELPEDPTRENYNFDGWSGNYTNIQKAETVTATYSAEIVGFTVEEVANANWKFTKGKEYDVKKMLVVTKVYADETTEVAGDSEYTTDFSTKEVGTYTLNVKFGSFPVNKTIKYSVEEEVKFQTKFEVIYTGSKDVDYTNSDSCTKNCDKGGNVTKVHHDELGVEIIEHYEELISVNKVNAVYKSGSAEGLLKTNGHIRYSYKKCTAWSPFGWCLFGSWEYYDPVYYAINNTADIRFNNSNSLLDYVDVYYTNKETRKSYVIRFEYDDTTKKFTAKSEKQY